MRLAGALVLMVMLLTACERSQEPTYTITEKDTSAQITEATTALQPTDGTPAMNDIQTGSVKASELIAYARTLIGIPYKYGSIDPAEGFDCSGFITYVFNHFNIAVPRTSVDFTNVHDEVPLTESRPGDLILFTGTDPEERTVGHMGIVLSEKGQPVTFIHSTSGKAKGVVETLMNDDYQKRFVKVVRVFK